jgi:predicted GH43/DUF377 family glycosyl hydrolase
MIPFQLQRLGMLMEPEPGNPQEIEGVLNPAAVRGLTDISTCFHGSWLKGNFSRIGIARVKFNQAGDPCGVERLGIALEPEADYERTSHGGGGCEDPRVTFVEPLQRYVMTYAALSSIGPRIAFAISEDLFHWKRLGLATFAPYEGIDFVHVDNKDASLFPIAISNHCGKMQMALLHRPLFPAPVPRKPPAKGPREVDLDHESIWISYCPMPKEGEEPEHLGLFNSHHRLAAPVAPWARLKIGAGTPPVLTRHGWMIIYHGVSEMAGSSNDAHHFCYSAGVMVLSKEHPREILYRSAEPILTRRSRRNALERLATSFSPPASTAATTSVRRIALTYIMGWPTTESAWRALICRIPCHREESPPSRKGRCNAPEIGSFKSQRNTYGIHYRQTQDRRLKARSEA